MNLQEYETRIRRAIRCNETESFTELRIRDAYPLLLGISCVEAANRFKENNYFDLVKSEENGFYRFNYKPGTVFADLSDWKPWDDMFLDEEHGDLVSQVLQARCDMHGEYQTKVILHAGQDKLSIGKNRVLNKGHKMAATEEVAVGLTVLRIIEMIKKDKISACFPREFYRHPEEETLKQIFWYHPHEAKSRK